MSKLNKVLVKHGPYKFLVSRWSEISDINIANNIFNTEFFRSEIKPIPLEITKEDKVLILAPHQDDEAIGCGGLMFHCMKHEVKSAVCFVTDGAQNNLAGKSVQESILIRRAEAHRACAMTNSNVYDLDISNLDFKVTKKDVDQFCEIINEFKPTIVTLPWFFDGPIKHRFFNQFLQLVYPRLKHTEFQILGYQVHNQIYPNVFLDISDYADQKEEMIKVYESQNSSFVAYDHITRGINAWNSRYMYNVNSKSKKQYAELFLQLPAKEYLKLVKETYKIENQIYLENKDLIDGIESTRNALR